MGQHHEIYGAKNPPPAGAVVYWRWRFDKAVGQTKERSWRIGYVNQVAADVIRMGLYDGDVKGGPYVACNDIQWRPAK